jgi:translation elongation factor EF-1alpha
VEAYSDYKALGRLTLRDGGVTLAVGVITSLDCE